jgi:hypothetical protein
MPLFDLYIMVMSEAPPDINIDANEEGPNGNRDIFQQNRETIAEKRAITMRDYELR